MRIYRRIFPIGSAAMTLGAIVYLLFWPLAVIDWIRERL